MHHLEDVFVLEGDVQVHVFAEFSELFVQFVHVTGGVSNVAGHGHDEVFFHDSLADVDDVDVGPGHNIADTGDDAHFINTGDGDDAYLPRFLFCHVRVLFSSRLFSDKRIIKPATGEVNFQN